MTPGELDYPQLGDNIGVCDVEIVLQIGDVDPAVEVLFHVLLASVKGRLSHVKTHLGSWIAYEAIECGMSVGTRTRAWLLRLAGIAIA